MKLHDLLDKLTVLYKREGLSDAEIEIAHVSPSLTAKGGRQAVAYQPIHSITTRKMRGKTRIEIVVIGKV